MSTFPLSIDGAIVAAHDARVSALDAGFALGLAAFDTLLVDAGRARLRARHFARLRDTCAFLSLRVSAGVKLEQQLEAYLAHLSSAEDVVVAARPLAVRTTVTRGTADRAGATVMAARTFDPPPPDGAVLAVERRFALAGDALDRHKTTNRARHVLAREAARAAGAFDALLLHADGDVADATSANVWARIDGELSTPPLERGALDGIARAVLLESLARDGRSVRERALSCADLARADEVFLTSSLHRVVFVRAIDGVVTHLPGPDGPAARAALDLLLAAEDEDG